LLSIIGHCGGNMKIYMDDERQTPEGWHRTYTVEETIQVLETRQVTDLSLDNDLGEGRLEGFKVLDWLEEAVYNDHEFPMPFVTIHSSNSARVEHMKRTILSIERIRQQQVGGS
jgi:hypothetical protein